MGSCSLLPESVYHAPNREEILAWQREHGLDPGKIFRIDLLRDLQGGVYGVIHEYLVNEDGKPYWDGSVQDVAKRESYIVPLRSWPPGGWVPNGGLTERMEGIVCG